MGSRSSLPVVALVGVTVVWGLTFVQVQDALELYPLFAFLAVRFAISVVVLAPLAWRPLGTMPREGILAGAAAGLVLALAYALQTAGIERTTVTNAGFITGLYVVFTPLLALVAFRTPIPLAVWIGILLSVGGLLLLSGVPQGSAVGNVLVLGSALAAAVQITAVERFAPLFDVRAFTFVQMAVCSVVFVVLALARGETELPTGTTVWGALIVTGVFAGALGYLVATWVQARTTAARAALIYTLEAPFAALFGVLLAGDRLGWIGWTGCALTIAAIILAEPSAASLLRRLARPAPTQLRAVPDAEAAIDDDRLA